MTPAIVVSGSAMIASIAAMPVTGNQIKAARALAGMDQKGLADAAGVGINTIRNFEGWGKEIVRGRLDTMEAIREAFKVAGVELLEDGQSSTQGRGVRLKQV
ncbi:helix-turn-helix transcriptional regulator [Mesorhizobium sp. B2-3-5]|uniref:helix-turn-helix transcriptional regulator n=1 Tax=Mesorhizobium sp. B2-3-5 TaxID=2589958 RepID=UPI001FEE0A48|nr:helix-turn-helix transcriptional regulator [Mesorhizobium sp. B2-3-5]